MNTGETRTLRSRLESRRQAGGLHSLLVVCWKERKKDPRQMVALSRAVGRALGANRPATHAELMRWYEEHGASRDGELLDLMEL